MTDWTRVLKTIAPRADARFVAAAAVLMDGVCAKWQINTPRRQAHLLAHMAHESQGFTKFEESLFYSDKRLCQVWPKRFPTPAAARPFAKNPKALANNVYGNRMGNRPGTDDGWAFRGSGPLMHTGRSEFARVRGRTGLDVVNQPDQLRDCQRVAPMIEAAATYFVDRGALPYADADDILGTTKMVNGGLIGLEDRRIYLARAKDALRQADSLKPAPKPAVKTSADKHQDAQAAASKAVKAGPVAAGGGGAGAGVWGLDTWEVITLVAIVAWLLRRRAQKLEPPPRFVQIAQAQQENAHA